MAELTKLRLLTLRGIRTYGVASPSKYRLVKVTGTMAKSLGLKQESIGSFAAVKWRTITTESGKRKRAAPVYASNYVYNREHRAYEKFQPEKLVRIKTLGGDRLVPMEERQTLWIKVKKHWFEKQNMYGDYAKTGSYMTKLPAKMPEYGQVVLEQKVRVKHLGKTITFTAMSFSHAKHGRARKKSLVAEARSHMKGAIKSHMAGLGMKYDAPFKLVGKPKKLMRKYVIRKEQAD